MTRLGASYYNTGSLVDVTTIGTGSTDGWTRVALLPQSQLPAQTGNDAYVIVAWCSVGAVDWPGGVSSSQHALCEVALGDDLAPFADQRHRVLLSDARLYRGRVRNEYPMAPVFFCHIRSFGIRTTWPSATRGMALWARISANSDPVPIITGSSFRVANIGIQAWSLTSLASTQYVIERRAPVPYALTNLAPGNQFVTAQAGQFQGTGDWMIFTGVRYWPGVHSHPVFRTTFTPDGTYGSVQPGFGRGSRWGQRARYQPQGGLQSSGRWDQQCSGGMFIRSSPESAGQIVLHGYDPLGFSGADPRNAALAEWDVFAVKASAVLSNFNFLQESAPTVVSFYNGLSLSNQYEAQEITRTYSEDVEVFFNAAAANTSGNPSFNHTIETNQAGGRVQDIASVVSTGTSDQHGHIGRRIQAIQPGLIQFRFYAKQPTWETPWPTYIAPVDFAAASWGWENAPNNTITPQPIAPAATFLIPTRESLDASLLSFPPASPDIEVEEVFETLRHEFVAEDGTRRTWPRWLGVRRLFRFSWSGRTNAEKDAIVEFFRLNRTFKWTHHDQGGPFALALVGDLTVQDVGVLSTVSINAVELVWTGSGA